MLMIIIALMVFIVFMIYRISTENPAETDQKWMEYRKKQKKKKEKDSDWLLMT